MDINAAFPSKYLKASDLNGQEVTLTMSHVTIDDVGGSGEEGDSKPVLYFKGKSKGLVLNKTNSRTIAGMYSPETDGWVGKPIIIFPTQTEFGGQAVACIRVKIEKPPPPNGNPEHGSTEAVQIDDDDIPF